MASQRTSSDLSRLLVHEEVKVTRKILDQYVMRCSPTKVISASHKYPAWHAIGEKKCDQTVSAIAISNRSRSFTYHSYRLFLRSIFGQTTLQAERGSQTYIFIFSRGSKALASSRVLARLEEARCLKPKKARFEFGSGSSSFEARQNCVRPNRSHVLGQIDTDCLCHFTDHLNE